MRTLSEVFEEIAEESERLAILMRDIASVEKTGELSPPAGALQQVGACAS